MRKQLIHIFEHVGTWWLVLITFGFFIAMNRLIFSYVERFQTLSEGLPMIELPTLVTGSLYAVAAQYPAEAVQL